MSIVDKRGQNDQIIQLFSSTRQEISTEVLKAFEQFGFDWAGDTAKIIYRQQCVPQTLHEVQNQLGDRDHSIFDKNNRIRSEITDANVFLM